MIRATLSAALIVTLFVITPVLATAGRAAAACGAGYVPEIHHTLTGLEEDEYWDTYCAPHGY